LPTFRTRSCVNTRNSEASGPGYGYRLPPRQARARACCLSKPRLGVQG